MMQRRHYPNTPYERQGQYNIRSNEGFILTPKGYVNVKDVVKGSEVISTGENKPDCIVFVSKRRGWGTTGNHESQPVTPSSIPTMMKSFPGKTHMRYKVNIYLKR